MKKKLTMLAALVLVFALGVTGTLAYLTATTKTVTNTFTVGNIAITLTEDGATADANGNLNKSYKVIPGATNKKEPIVTVTEGSEKCYVYAYIDNQLVLNGKVVGTLDIITTDWIEVKTVGTATVYRYKEVVDASAGAKPLTVFSNVTYSEDITMENIGGLNAKNIVVKAFAHQSENVTQADANAAATAHFFTTT